MKQARTARIQSRCRKKPFSDRSAVCTLYVLHPPHCSALTYAALRTWLYFYRAWDMSARVHMLFIPHARHDTRAWRALASDRTSFA